MRIQKPPLLWPMRRDGLCKVYRHGHGRRYSDRQRWPQKPFRTWNMGVGGRIKHIHQASHETERDRRPPLRGNPHRIMRPPQQHLSPPLSVSLPSLATTNPFESDYESLRFWERGYIGRRERHRLGERVWFGLSSAGREVAQAI